MTKKLVEIISPLYSRIMLLKDRLYWMRVFLWTYVSSQRAETLALRWAEDLREDIIRKHNNDPEALIHPGKQAEDNLPFMLAIIEGYKKRFQRDFIHVRIAALLHMKGKGLIMERQLKWYEKDKRD
jgi:hypothetical protein